jgi:hypothetical protein
MELNVFVVGWSVDSSYKYFFQPSYVILVVVSYSSGRG